MYSRKIQNDESGKYSRKIQNDESGMYSRKYKMMSPVDLVAKYILMTSPAFIVTKCKSDVSNSHKLWNY